MSATSPAYGPSTVNLYGPSTANRRKRSSRSQLQDLDDAIWEATQRENPVSVRGIFYRVEAAGFVPKSEAGYRQVSREVLKMRRAGVLPYNWVTDGTRLIRKSDSYEDVTGALRDMATNYRRAIWSTQPVEVMLFSEKDAITGSIFPVTDRWDVPLGVTRGYSSETFTYNVAQDIVHAGRAGKPVYVYQVGDHDPSGVNAWETFTRRITAFVRDELGDCNAHFQRLAVTPQQIDGLQLPTRPTKTTDTRARGFEGQSVEVDAVPARILREIVEEAILSHLDEGHWHDAVDRQDREQRQLVSVLRAFVARQYKR